MLESRKYVFPLVLTVVFLLGTFSLVPAAEYSIYGEVQNFVWKEYKDDGSKLLEESGPIYGIVATGKFRPYRNLTLKTKGEVFAGSIDYDGQTQGGTPVSTDTNYVGFKVEQDVGWKFLAAEKTTIEPFAGVGYRLWYRDLESTSSAIGYTEKWQSFYGRLGVGAGYIPYKRIKIFAEGGVKYPFYNRNKVDLFGVTLEPGKKASSFAEAGLEYCRYYLLRVSAFYEGMRFSKSPVVNNLYQPESKADIFGVSLGVVF